MIKISATKEQEAPILAEIQRLAFLPLYEKYHDEGNPCLRGIEDVANRLTSPIFRYFTIFEDDKIVGGVLYKCKGKTPFIDGLKDGEYYLQRIYITPERQCNKIAQQAILLCEKEFCNAKTFYVDFPQDLIKNKKCYEAAGFCDTGKRLQTDSAVVLALSLIHI